MALKTVTGKITRPDSVVGAVSLRIVLSAPAVIAGTQEIVPAAIDVTVAPDGTWSQQLQANLDLLPGTTSYTALETIGGVTAPFIFVVPQTAGPFKLADILAAAPAPSPPAALDSAVVHIANPETITGDKTFAGSMIEGKDFHRSAQTISEAVLVSGVDATAGELVDVTLTANRVVGLPLNPAVGQELVLLVTMGGAGGYKLTYPAGIKTAWQPASAVGDISALRLRYFGTNWQQIGGQVAVSQLGVLAHAGPAVVGSLTVRDPSSSSANTPVLADGVTATPSGVSFGQLYDWGGAVYNLKAIGAKGTGKIISDAAITNGQAILTSPSNALVGAVPGMVVGVVGAGVAGATLVTTILSVQSAGQVTLNATAGAGVSGAKAAFGDDDTAATQAWFNKVPTSGALGFGAELEAPPAIYLLTGTQTLPKAYHGSVHGAHHRAAYFLMLTDAIPILKTADELMHSWNWDQVGFGYLARQGAANTNAYGLMLHAAAAGAGNGWFHWHIGRIYFENTYVAMGFDPAGTGKYAWWGNEVDFFWANATQHTAIRLVSPTGIGMPTNKWGMVKIYNTGAGITPDGPAVDMNSCEANFSCLNIEDWANVHVNIDGTYPVGIRQLHFERMTLNSAPGPIVNVNGARVTIEQAVYESTQGTPAFGGGVFEYCFQVGATGRLTVRDFKSNLVAPSTGNYQLIKAAAGAKVFLADINDDTGGIGAANIPAPAADTTTLGTIIQYETNFLSNTPMVVATKVQMTSNPASIETTVNGGGVALRSNGGLSTDAVTSGSAGGTFKVGGQLYPGTEATFATQTSGGFLHATAVPSNSHGNNNDWCISDNGHLYFRAAGAWSQII